MDVNKNARSVPASRELLFKRVSKQGWSVREASEAAGISERRGREWKRRAAAGEALTDRSSRPHRSRALDERTRKRVLEFRREWRTFRQIGQGLGVSQSSVSRICRSAGPDRFRQARPVA